MSATNSHTETYLIQNEALATVFSFLAFVFVMSLLGLLVSLLLNFAASIKLILLSFLGLSVLTGVLINWLDKRILIRNSEKQLEKLLQGME